MGKPRWENPSFFKVMFGDSRKSPRISPSFKKHLRVDLDEKSVLRNPRGAQWNVEIGRRDGDLYFEGGWENFVSDNKVSMGDFLVFFYDGDLGFDVKIYGKSGCEKWETLPAKEKENEESRYHSGTTTDCPNLVRVRTSPRLSEKMKAAVDGKKDKNPDATSTGCPNLNREKISRSAGRKRKAVVLQKKDRNPSKASSYCPNLNGDKISPSAGRKRKASVLPKKGRPSKTSSNCPNLNREKISPRPSRKRKAPVLGKKDRNLRKTSIDCPNLDREKISSPASKKRKAVVLAKNSKPYAIVTRSSKGVERKVVERKNASKAASSSKTANLRIMVTCRKSFLRYMTIPKKTAEALDLRTSRQTVLLDPCGRPWLVQIACRTNGQMELGIGWMSFSIANNLREGNACLFEFIRGADVIKVSVFPSIRSCKLTLWNPLRQ